MLLFDTKREHARVCQRRKQPERERERERDVDARARAYKKYKKYKKYEKYCVRAIFLYEEEGVGISPLDGAFPPLHTFVAWFF